MSKKVSNKFSEKDRIVVRSEDPLFAIVNGVKGTIKKVSNSTGINDEPIIHYYVKLDNYTEHEMLEEDLEKLVEKTKIIKKRARKKK